MFPWNFLTIVQIEILFTAGYLFIENKFCDCNWTRTQNPEPPASSKEFVDIQATIECGFTLKRVRDTSGFSEINPVPPIFFFFAKNLSYGMVL